MFKKNIFILCWLISYSLLAQQPFTGNVLIPQIIPEPVKIEVQKTYLPFYNQITLEFRLFSNENKDLKEIIEKSVEKFQTNHIPQKNSLTIQFILNDKMGNNMKKEGYHLSVQKKGIIVEAKDQAGLYYGLQTLLQILPIKQDNNVTVTNIPFMDIIDYPRFEWRGLMLDVSRHFFNKKEVFKFIDNMVRYKYNILHLHLSDDEGWRIEIKSLPKLTEVGAWRATRTGKWANTKDAFEYENKNYGGFYTQEDIKEIIKYAQQRFVQILPEIDVPGHSMALLAAYPFLSCSKENAQVHIGTPFIDWDKFPFLVAYKDNSVNPANPLVYEYMDKIFTEIAQLFPFEYIHIGGDECVKNYWDNNKEVKDLMAKENLHNSEEVQSYFTKKILHLIQSKNKKVIGWDEILEGGLDSNAAVMSWRGEDGGIKASNEKHKVVMTPAGYCYLDYYQGEKMVEPPVYRGLRLSTTYMFDPIPKGINPTYVLGGQGNLWTEQIQNNRSLEYMVWPRAIALAEKLWTDTNNTSWTKFSNKLAYHFNILDNEQIRYSTALYDPIITTTINKYKQIEVTFTPEVAGLEMYYSIDESIPDNFYPKYTNSFILPDDVANLKVVAYKNGQLVSKLLSIPIEELNKRAIIKN